MATIATCFVIATSNLARAQEPAFIALATGFDVCATSGTIANNCAEGFHVSDQILVQVAGWNFGPACGPFGFGCRGDVEFSGDLGNTAIDPFFAGMFGPGGALQHGTCQLQAPFLSHFVGPAFATQYAKPGFHTLTATFFQCQQNPNDLFGPLIPTNQVLATTTMTINVLPDHHPDIDSVEITQAIQEFQRLPELQADLGASGEPPVPVIANKPAVLRVYMRRFDQAADVRIDISGPLSQSKFLTLQPQCVPQTERRRTNGCQSVDFYFTPPVGPFPTMLTLFDINGNTLETDTLSFESRQADKLLLKAVSVCDAKDANGIWKCALANPLAGDITKLRKLAPTDDVQVQITGLVVRKEFTAFNSEFDWWNAVVKDIDGFFGLFDVSDFLPGIHGAYFGMVRPNILGGIGGDTHALPSRGAAARTSVIRFGMETIDDVVAHEIGHSLGGHHTGTNNPPTAAPPGCYNLAGDPQTDWPFPGDNRIQSVTQLETGFDLVAGQPIIPDSTYDIMSYCIPRWISPFHYRQFMNSLGATASIPVPPPPLSLPVVAEFWTVSGTIGNSVEFDPVFQLQTAVPQDAGSGTHQIQVLDSSGAVLFDRFFTPANSSTETSGTDVQGPPTFSELIPVTAGAAQIVVLDPSGAQIGGLTLGGLSPVVQLIAPAPGAILSGVQTISWSATNPNNRTLTTKVLYSPNNGGRWIQLDQLSGSNLSIIDFDTVPGGVGSALIQLIVSDGINTGRAVSAPFTVSKKADIAAQILTPQMNSVYQKGDLVMLTASAYNVDNGVLDGPSINWSSNLDGFLGNGATLPIYNLQTGTHQITMTAADQDNNIASKSVTIRVAGPPPVMTLDVHPLDSAPSTCVQVTINAAPGSVELTQIDYSLDNGTTFTQVPLSSGPYTFIVPGSGSFHLLARAFDAANQITVKGAQFSTSGLCQSDTIPPVTTAVAAPQPNTAGWNNSDVTVVLNSTDNEVGGSGVKQIQFSLTGAQTGSGIVQGNNASFTISKEGATLLSFAALDNAGNLESIKTLTIKLDKTPPSIVGSRSPAANVNGWNNTPVIVSFACSDSLSGLASGSPPANTVLSSEGTNQQVTGTCQDIAGNMASATMSGINIDLTPPTIAGLSTDCSLWPPNHKLVQVAVVNATDALSGPAGFNIAIASSEADGDQPQFLVSGGPLQPQTIQLRAERSGNGPGRVYTISATASDLAGNAATSSATCTVPHDQSGK